MSVQAEGGTGSPWRALCARKGKKDLNRARSARYLATLTPCISDIGSATLEPTILTNLRFLEYSTDPFVAFLQHYPQFCGFFIKKCCNAAQDQYSQHCQLTL